MRKPVQRASDGVSRSMRRDLMVGTAALVLVEASLGAAATAMGSDHGPEQLQPDQPEDQPTRPVGGTDGVPNTQIGISTGLRAVPPPPSDDYDAPLLSYGLGGAGGHTGSFGGGFANISPHGGSAPHHASGGFDTGIVRSPAHQSISGLAASDTGSAERSSAPPPSTPAEMDVKVGTDGDDVILGSDDNDYAFGRGGSDHILGGGGNDRLLGGDGDDVLSGGAGNDSLVGEKGNDELTGGAGADTFFFRAGYGNDVITDFQANGDKDVIEVAKSEFTNFAALSSHLTDTDVGVVLTLDDGSTLTLKHVHKASLTASDFHFEV